MLPFIWKWIIGGGLIGYFLLYPLVMIPVRLMADASAPTAIADIFRQEIRRLFLADMSLCSLGFAACAAFLAGIYGKFRQTGRRLRRSQKIYRLLFDSAPMGIAVATFEGQLLTANPALLKMLGYTADELRQINLQDIYQQPEERLQMIQRVQQENTLRDVEVTLVRKNGGLFHASINLTRFTEAGDNLILGVVNDISLRKRAIKALQTSERELRQLSVRLLKVQEEERQRIAQELHDSVGQLMHALNFSMDSTIKKLQQAELPAGILASLTELKPLIQETSRETRRIVMNLRPSMLDDLGLLATLNWFCREYQKVYSHITVEKDFQIEEAAIPTRLRVVVFRILQEAFNNIAKHSQADEVFLGIQKTTDGLEIQINDNGQGMNSDIFAAEGSITRGLGISSMRERARACGGSIQIQTHPGSGTHLKLKLPTGLNETRDWC